MTKALLSILGASLLSTAAQAQATWYVDVNGTPPGSGSQADPFTSIQSAISQVGTVSGDTVQVAPGTYVENLDHLGKDITVRSAGGRDVTIIDGGGLAPVVSWKGGETAAAVLDGFALRNGLGVPSGFPDRLGGGVYCVGASPTLRNLDVYGNIAGGGAGIYLSGSAAWITDSLIHENRGTLCAGSSYSGMGIYAVGGSLPVVERCDIYANSTASYGGGINGSGTFRHCTIRSNAAFQGAGVHTGGGLELFDCVIQGNSIWNCDSIANGGGIYGPATATRCIIANNSAYETGGGAYGATLIDCTVRDNTVRSEGGQNARGGGAWGCELTNCDVFDNEALSPTSPSGSRGGGIYGGTATDCRIYGNVATNSGSFSSSTGGGAWGATLVRCEVYGNVASGPSVTMPGQSARGGGAYNCTSQRSIFYSNGAENGAGVWGGTLTHCVVYENTATISEGGIAEASSVLNTIVWGNVPPAISATGNVTYSLVEGGFAGVGNISAPPRFYDPEASDFHLLSDSPCIDAGNPASPLDPDGSIADLGVFPFDPNYCPSAQPYCVAKVNSQGCTPEIDSTGAPSLTGPDDFVITARRVRNDKIGFLFYGSVADAIPFVGGTLCIRPPVQRFGAQLSGGSPGSQQDCSGTYSFHFTQARMQNAGLLAGQTVHLQIVYRDPPIGDGTGAGLTDALEATICP